DGTRGPDELAAALAREGWSYSTDAVRRLVERCAALGMLVGHTPREPHRSWVQRLFYFRIRLFDPDRHLGGLARAWGLLRSAWLLWPVAALIASGAYVVLHELPAIARGGLDQLTPSNVPWLLASVFVVKLLHELGHAAAAKYHGCRVDDAGVAFLCLMPCLYVDTSHAWQLPDRGRRAEIAGAGIGVELMIAAIAAHVWNATDVGTANAIAFYLMTTSLAMSLVLNANPLMRFDGYFLACDLLGQPNLGPRSSAVLRYYVFHGWLGIPNVPDPSVSNAERRWLAGYGVASSVWRILVAWFIAHAVYARFFPALGALLGAMALWQFLLAPIAKLAVEVVRVRRSIRPRLVPSIVVAALVTGFLAFAALPVSSHDSFPCVLGPERTSVIVASIDGRVRQRLVERGDSVRPGEALFVLGSSELERDARLAAIELRIAEQRRDAAQSNEHDWQRVAVAAPAVVAAEQRLERLREDLEHRITQCDEPGLVVEVDPGIDPGSSVQRGQVLGRI
ncbi:MAG: hypothetical protein KDB80_02500, partial [Planctomycetes bacterium]|nr:hypothetical protein [Planctomycetota bacterium]